MVTPSMKMQSAWWGASGAASFGRVNVVPVWVGCHCAGKTPQGV